MTNPRKYHRRLRFFLRTTVMAAMMAAVSVAPVAQAQEQKPTLSASDIADGMRLYQQKGNCQACHGWAGDGRKADSQMPDGPNLRETKLNRDGLILPSNADGSTRKCRLSTSSPTATGVATARSRRSSKRTRPACRTLRRRCSSARSN